MPHVLYELYMHDNSYNVDDNKFSQKPSKFSQFPWHTTYLIKWISSAKQNAQYNNFDRLYLKGKEIVDEWIAHHDTSTMTDCCVFSGNGRWVSADGNVENLPFPKRMCVDDFPLE